VSGAFLSDSWLWEAGEDPEEEAKRSMSLVELVPIIVVLVIVGTDLWVYTDARTRADSRDPVVFSIGSIRLDSPQVWAVVCLVLWVFCFPLYLASRNSPT